MSLKLSLPASGSDINRPRNSVSSLHAHLPQRAFQMLYTRRNGAEKRDNLNAVIFLFAPLGRGGFTRLLTGKPVSGHLCDVR